MLWKLFQIAIVAAVLFSNVHWQWTPNPLVAGLIGVGVAYLVTRLALGVYSYLQRLVGWLTRLQH